MCLIVDNSIANLDELCDGKDYFIAYKDLNFYYGKLTTSIASYNFEYNKGWTQAIGDLSKKFNDHIYEGALHCLLNKEAVIKYYKHYPIHQFTRLVEVRVYKKDFVAFGIGLGVEGVAAKKVFITAAEYTKVCRADYQKPEWL